MDKEFGSAGDQTGQEPTKVGDDGKTNTSAPDLGITAEELAVLRTRDQAAQAHIPTIETENDTLREQVTELKNSLSSATTLEEVMNRLGESDEKIVDNADPDKVADQVEQRLQRRTQQRIADDNWTDVYAKVEETYGTWDKGNEEIQAKCDQLKMSTQEATILAKQSPAAFYELFLPRAGTPAQSSAASATGKQTSTPPLESTGKRDRAYYKELRKKNANKYWSADVQAQMRRDIYGA